MNLLARLLDVVCPDRALRLPRFSPLPPLDPGPSVPRFDAFQATDLAEAEAEAEAGALAQRMDAAVARSRLRRDWIGPSPDTPRDIG